MTDDAAPETVPIPEPAGLPLLGHVRTLEPEFPLGSMLNLAKTHGNLHPVSSAICPALWIFS